MYTLCCAIFAVSTRSLVKHRNLSRLPAPPPAVVQPRLAAESPPLLPRARVGSRRALPAQQVAMPISLRSGRSGTRPPTSYRDANISPTLSATTSASKLDLGEEGPKIIVTRADVRPHSSAYVPAEWETEPAARAPPLPTCSSANPSPRTNSFSPPQKDTGTPSSRSPRRRRPWQARSANAHESRVQAIAERT